MYRRERRRRLPWYSPWQRVVRRPVWRSPGGSEELWLCLLHTSDVTPWFDRVCGACRGGSTSDWYGRGRGRCIPVVGRRCVLGTSPVERCPRAARHPQTHTRSRRCAARPSNSHMLSVACARAHAGSVGGGFWGRVEGVGWCCARSCAGPPPFRRRSRGGALVKLGAPLGMRRTLRSSIARVTCDILALQTTLSRPLGSPRTRTSPSCIAAPQAGPLLMDRSSYRFARRCCALVTALCECDRASLSHRTL